MSDQETVEGYYNVKTGRVVLRTDRNAPTFDGMTEMKRATLKRDPDTNAWVPDSYLGEKIDAATAGDITRIAERIDMLNNQKNELFGLAAKLSGGKSILEELGLWEEPSEEKASELSSTGGSDSAPLPPLTPEKTLEEEFEEDFEEPPAELTPTKEKGGGKLGITAPSK